MKKQRTTTPRPRPSSLETLAFTLELLKRIPRGRKVTASELWEQLKDAGWQRDLRTVQRQLDELSQHFDIEPAFAEALGKPFAAQHDFIRLHGPAAGIGAPSV